MSGSNDHVIVYRCQGGWVVIPGGSYDIDYNSTICYNIQDLQETIADYFETDLEESKDNA